MASKRRRPLGPVINGARVLPLCCAERRALAWIRVHGSMTRALAAASARMPAVIPHYEGPDRLRRFEARALGVPARQRAYAREIALSVAGSNVMLARTVTVMGDPALPMLRGLSRTPLAEVLFADPTWCRPRSCLALETPPAPEHPRLTGRMCLWQRRGGGRLLVQEYFLPGMLQYTPASSEVSR